MNVASVRGRVPATRQSDLEASLSRRLAVMAANADDLFKLWQVTGDLDVLGELIALNRAYSDRMAEYALVLDRRRKGNERDMAPNRRKPS